MLCKLDRSIVPTLVFQEELGEENKTPHIQGALSFQDKNRPIGKLKLPKEVKWILKCKNSSLAEFRNYCCREDKRREGGRVYLRGWRVPRPIKLIDPTLYWEIEILEIIKEEADDRTIHWYWSKEGAVGKTCFCKYLSVMHGAIPLHGKGADIRNGVNQYMMTNKMSPDLVVFPVPRSYGAQYISYEGLENIKDMYFYSGKYEGGTILGNSPHLFVFANEPPELEKCSPDRWRVVEIVSSIPDDDSDEEKEES